MIDIEERTKHTDRIKIIHVLIQTLIDRLKTPSINIDNRLMRGGITNAD